MIARCESLGSSNSKNLGTFKYRGNKIDYTFYKSTDSAKHQVKTCYLQGSPQILMGTYAFAVLVASILMEIWNSRSIVQSSQMLMHLEGHLV